MKIKVAAEEQKITVVEYKYPGAKRMQAEYPIVLTAIAPVNYFQTRPSLSIIGMISGNPMIIMMLFSLVIVIGFPAMLKNMSPEELKELQGRSAASTAGSGDPMAQFQKLMGMESKADDDDE